MRFIVYTIFLGGWMIIWWWVYVFHIKDCDAVVERDQSMEVAYEKSLLLPLSFKWSDATPVLSGRFEPWRDSIILSLKADQVLQVTGLSYRDEAPSENIADLGLQRAHAIMQLFAALLPSERLLMRTAIGEITADIQHRNFPGYRLQALVQNEDVHEMSECALIRFPVDSLTDAGVTTVKNYLDYFIARLLQTDESVLLMTHLEPGTGKNAEYQRIVKRMSVLKEMMVSAGMPADAIMIADSTYKVPVQCIADQMHRMDKDWIAMLFLR